MTDFRLSEFISTQTSLLKLEQEAESEQTKAAYQGQSGSQLEKQGLCITKLCPLSQATGTTSTCSFSCI